MTADTPLSRDSRPAAATAAAQNRFDVPAEIASPTDLAVERWDGAGGRLPPIAETWEACLARAPQWQQLFTYNWYATWMQTYGARAPWTGRSHVLIVKTRTGEPVALLPLAEMRLYGVTVWSLAGFFQPNRAFVCRQDYLLPACEALADELFTAALDWRVLRLGPVNAGLPEIQALHAAFRGNTRNIIVKHLSPMIMANSLPASFDDYQRHVLGKRFYKDILYYERRLRRTGQVALRHFSNPRGQELETMLCDCRQVEGRSWLTSAAGQLRFAGPLDFSFWSGLEFDGTNRRLDTWLLYVDHRPVSFALTMTAGATRHMIANQYDPDFHRYSTGSILYLRAIEDAIRYGITAVDFGAGDLHYKGRWGGTEGSPRGEIICFRPSASGWMLRQGLEAMQLLARAKTSLSRAVRRWQKAIRSNEEPAAVALNTADERP